MSRFGGRKQASGSHPAGADGGPRNGGTDGHGDEVVHHGVLRQAPPPGQGGGNVDTKALKEQVAELPVTALSWADERTGATPLMRAFLYRKVPKGLNWFQTFGSATLFAFVSQAVTGVFLAMYYDPSPVRAYDSVVHLTNNVFAGELVRGMHRWGATVMILLLFLHMARTFVWGAYKYPRELTWVIGVVILVLSFVMGLTGYLLPFDQRAYWATIVGVNITAAGPVVGPYMADFLRGGSEFGAATLTRFYAIHMMLVPGLIGALIAAHLYLVAKLGVAAPPWVRAEKSRELSKERI
jgi:quinol-cytochrome oxidoreductase complex cytochrome b subunit